MGKICKTVENKNRVNLPKWGIVFIIACAIIPVFSVEGVIPLAIGIWGIYKCTKTLKNIDKPKKDKLKKCMRYIVLTYGFYVIYYVISGYVSDYLVKKLL